MLPPQFAQDADRLARFEREARLLASLNHPNIAAIYDLEEHEGLRFLDAHHVSWTADGNVVIFGLQTHSSIWRFRPAP